MFELPVKGSTHVDPIDLINAELPTDRHEDIMQQVELYQVYPHSYKSTVKLGSITEYSIRVEYLIDDVMWCIGCGIHCVPFTMSPVVRKNRAATSTIKPRYRQKYFLISMKMNGNKKV